MDAETSKRVSIYKRERVKKKVKESEVKVEEEKGDEKKGDATTTSKAEVKPQTVEGVEGAKRSGKEKHCKGASTSSYALKGCHRDVEEMGKALIGTFRSCFSSPLSVF